MRLKDTDRDISYIAIALAAIFWILSIAWMITIFVYSSESGIESTTRSFSILQFLKNLGIDFINENVVRKGAHVGEFALLAFLSFMAIRYTNMVSPSTSYSQTPVKIIKSDNEMYIVISFWICAVYAAIDEYHQLFVTGRNGSIYDFLIDMCGSIIVLLIIRVCFSINLRRHGLSELRYD